MSGWGIADTAPKIEKIKAESADYLHGLDSCGKIEWSTYSDAFDFYEDLIEKAYAQGKEDAQSEIKTDGDTISRRLAIKTALEFFVEYYGGAFRENEQRLLAERFDALPSVQPKHKTDGDTISRQAAIDAADKIIERDTSGSNAVVNAMIAWSEYIRTLPSAKPERKTGRWEMLQISTSTPIYKCSECGSHALQALTDFCPSCGAKMIKEGEG